MRLSTGTDSPVSAASSTRSGADSSRRMSAGTTLPASSSTMSPGTSPGAAISATLPSRTTRAAAAASCLSAAIARSARYSCTKPTIAFRTTITRMTMLSSGSPIRAEMAAATISTTIMKSVNWPASIRSGLRRACSRIAFGP